MPDVGKLMSGFRIFKATTYQKQKDVIHHLLLQGQKPTTMVISCVDIRIAPAEIFATNPGELYIVNNIGGFVPKYEAHGVHGLLSAIEYAVTVLEVQNIVVLGHAKCDGIKMMMSDNFVTSKGISESMKTWLSVAKEARDAVKSQLSQKTEEEQLSACEHESIIVSLRNLLTYPYIKKRMDENKLNIFGWHFNIESGSIEAFDPNSLVFEQIA